MHMREYMLLTYQEAADKKGGRNGLNKALESGELHRIARNLYANTDNISSLASISKLYPNAIITGLTALYLHGLTDVPPEKIDLVTKRGGTKISKPQIRQTYIPDDWINIGASYIHQDGIKIRAYDLERMLLELMRSRNKIPRDLYKEAVNSYRRRADELNIYKLEDYANRIPRGHAYLNRALEEVF